MAGDERADEFHVSVPLLDTPDFSHPHRKVFFAVRLHHIEPNCMTPSAWHEHTPRGCEATDHAKPPINFATRGRVQPPPRPLPTPWAEPRTARMPLFWSGACCPAHPPPPGGGNGYVPRGGCLLVALLCVHVRSRSVSCSP